MKLTNWHRSNIVKQIIDDVFVPKQKAYEKLLQKETEDFIFNVNNRKMIDDQLFSNIKEYVHTTNQVRLNFQIKDEWCHLYEYVEMEYEVALLSNESDELEFSITKENNQKIYKILLAGNALDQEKKEAEKSLETVLHSVNTVKQLLDLKPDFSKYIKDDKKPKQTTALVPKKDLDYVSHILKEAINKD